MRRCLYKKYIYSEIYVRMQCSASDKEVVAAPTKRILLALSTPRTVSQTAKLVGKKRIKLQHYVKKHWIAPLTSSHSKGRLYVLTEIGRKLLGVSTSLYPTDGDLELVSWLLASPKQRLALIKFVDAKQRTSEEIRVRARRQNSHLTRISAKAILNELVDEGLVGTSVVERLRYYWITDGGKSALGQALEILGTPLNS